MGGIYCKSCEKMEEIADGSIALVVTSPPYWNAIDYEVHVQDPKAWYRTRKNLSGYEEYLEWLKVCFGEVYRKQKPGGYCAVVIGSVLMNGKRYPLPHHFTILMEQIGYEFHEEIVWHKVTGGVKRAGVTLQNPYPGYYYPNIMTESILIYHKPGPKIYANRDETLRELSKLEIDELFTKELANNVWHIAPIPPPIIYHIPALSLRKYLTDLFFFTLITVIPC
ncbi:MAG: DNA methyltransferase [bacterium]